MSSITSSTQSQSINWTAPHLSKLKDTLTVLAGKVNEMAYKLSQDWFEANNRLAMISEGEYWSSFAPDGGGSNNALTVERNKFQTAIEKAVKEIKSFTTVEKGSFEKVNIYESDQIIKFLYENLIRRNSLDSKNDPGMPVEQVHTSSLLRTCQTTKPIFFGSLFSFLPREDYIQLRQICSLFNKQVDQEISWDSRFRNDFPHCFSVTNKPFKEQYRDRLIIERNWKIGLCVEEYLPGARGKLHLLSSFLIIKCGVNKYGVYDNQELKLLYELEVPDQDEGYSFQEDEKHLYVTNKDKVTKVHEKSNGQFIKELEETLFLKECKREVNEAIASKIFENSTAYYEDRDRLYVGYKDRSVEIREKQSGNILHKIVTKSYGEIKRIFRCGPRLFIAHKFDDVEYWDLRTLSFIKSISCSSDFHVGQDRIVGKSLGTLNVWDFSCLELSTSILHQKTIEAIIKKFECSFGEGKRCVVNTIFGVSSLVQKLLRDGKLTFYKDEPIHYENKVLSWPYLKIDDITDLTRTDLSLKNRTCFTQVFILDDEFNRFEMEAKSIDSSSK